MVDDDGARQPARVNPPSGPTFGDVVSATGRPTSKVEEVVKEALREAGFRIAKGPMGVVCHHPDRDGGRLTLAPDIVLRDLWLAIEVDPCGPAGSSGFSHDGEEEKDRKRNALLAEVGWTVIRLRLGASEGRHIGDRDVVVESAGFTNAAQAALREAIEDFRERRPARVRLVPKNKTPAPARRRSHVVNVGPDRYSDDSYWFTWYPDLDSTESYRLRLAASGRYLYAPSSRGSAFVDEVRLHEIDKSEWRERLTAYLAGREPNELRGTTKWPWGDTILVAPTQDVRGDPFVAELIHASDHEKQTIDRIDFWFTVTGDHISAWSAEALRRADESPIVTVHPEAAAVGYRFAEVTLARGYRGAYQRIAITRATTGEGHSVGG